MWLQCVKKCQVQRHASRSWPFGSASERLERCQAPDVQTASSWSFWDGRRYWPHCEHIANIVGRNVAMLGNVRQCQVMLGNVHLRKVKVFHRIMCILWFRKPKEERWEKEMRDDTERGSPWNRNSQERQQLKLSPGQPKSFDPRSSFCRCCRSNLVKMLWFDVYIYTYNY